MHAVPFLRNGIGQEPADGGCIMQVIHWIHSGKWTDRPECVHPVIRGAAIGANDNLHDDTRQQLLDLTSRMMGTSHHSDDRTDIGMVVDLLNMAVEDGRIALKPDSKEFLAALNAWLADPSAPMPTPSYNYGQDTADHSGDMALEFLAAYMLKALGTPNILCAMPLNMFPLDVWLQAAATRAFNCNVRHHGMMSILDRHTMRLLTDLLDKFEQAYDHKPVEQNIDWAPVCAVMQPV